MTERVARLKDRMLAMDDRTVFLERLFLMKRGYDKHRDRSPALRYALIFDEILSGMSVVVDEDDLIVGRAKETVPTDEEEQSLRRIAAYYSTVCPRAVAAAEIDVESRAFAGRPSAPPADPFSVISAPSWFSTLGHVTVSWGTLLSRGMQGIRDLAAGKAAVIGSADPDGQAKREFLEAVVISCDAVMSLASRYVEALDGLAGSETDANRRAELREIRDILERVPAHAATSFRESLQSVWFLDFIMHEVCGARDYAPGRMDQYLHRFYASDMERGLLTPEAAIELLQNFFVHTARISGLSDHTNGAASFDYTATAPVKRSLCRGSVQYLVLAGQTAEGGDGCNPLSFLILDAIDEVRTRSPAIVVRYHRNMDRDFWLKTCDLMRRSFNNIGVYNDEPVIEALVNCGVKPEDALNYSHYGCCNPGIPGKDAQIREDQRNLPKILELTLNDGFDPVTGTQRGPHTGSVEDFETFDRLMDAFRTQIEQDVARAVDKDAAKWGVYSSDSPFSFESCLLEGCVEMAMDCNDPRRNPAFGGPGYLHYCVHGGGLATAADSLAAIKKMVYDDKEISLAGLKEALDKNYEGYEMLRLKLINRCPKFGNDDDKVDSIAAEIGEAFCREVIGYGLSRPALGLCWPVLYTYHRYRSCGLETGATPDGRLAFEPVSENQSPTNGRDVAGLSALINSLSKLRECFRLTPGGGVTINVHPTTLAVQDGARLLASLLETYFEKGGLQIQLNTVDRNTLIEAKSHPQKYRDLMVRVTGYSAYFVTLSPESQDNMIARHAHSTR